MTTFSRPYLGLALRHPDVLQGTVQRDHITGHQVELVDLELLLLLLLTIFRDGHGFAHLTGHAVVAGHRVPDRPGIDNVTICLFVIVKILICICTVILVLENC